MAVTGTYQRGAGRRAAASQARSGQAGASRPRPAARRRGEKGGVGGAVQRTERKIFGVPERFMRPRLVLLAVVAALAAANVPLVAVACAQFSFYPALSTLVAWWGYLPYALLMALPPACAAKEWLRWRS